MTFETNVLYVDPAFTDDPMARRFATITAALAVCTGGEKILIAPGIYSENISVTSSGITIQGMNAPYYDTVTGRLINGTSIRGEIKLNSSVGTTIRDLGVDLVGVDNTDCISSNANRNDLHRHFENLTLLGNGHSALAHGLYEIGDHLTIRNVRVYNCYHGIAIHGSYVNVNDVYFYSCFGTSLVIKSKGSFHCKHINVNNVVIEGQASSLTKRAGAVFLQSSDNLDVRHVNISNVTATNCVNGVINLKRLDATGTISDVSISNVVSNANLDVAAVGDYRIETGDKITLTNCRSSNRLAGYGFMVASSDNVGQICVYSSYADSTGSGPYSGTFKMLELNGMDLRSDGITLAPTSQHRGAGLNGVRSRGGIRIAGPNTPVAVLANANGGIGDYAGILFVWVRNSTTTPGNSACYTLQVFRGTYTGTGVVTLLAGAGLTSGGNSNHPSFNFSLDTTNNHLVATPVGPTSGTFYFSFTALGHLSVQPT